jgi:glycosidase
MKNRSTILSPRLGVLFSLLFALGTGHAANETAAEPAPRPSPEWLRKSVVYQIFTRNFSKEGNFNAVTARLPELKDLGVDVIWLMPIHPIGQKMKKGQIGSPYSVRDYYAINPDYGTTNDLRQLISTARDNGMKVVLDIVAGHTSWDSVLMARPDFYKKDDKGRIVQPDPGWTDVAALDYNNPEVRRYMINVMKYWLADFKVDGFRCDVAFRVPIEFWETAREELEQLHKDVILLADANAMPNLLTKAFNMDSSGAFYLALNRVMSGITPAYLLDRSWENTRQLFPRGALHLRFSDGQAFPRAVARFGMNGAMAAQVLMLTLDGVPLFYNGMEAGDATESADPALFEKMPIFWQPGGRPPLREIYRDLIKLRKSHPAFYNDNVIWLQNSVPAEVVTILRQDEKNQFVVLINLSSHPVSGSVETPGATEFTQVQIQGTQPGPLTPLPEFRLGGYEWRIYKRDLASNPADAK